VTVKLINMEKMYRWRFFFPDACRYQAAIMLDQHLRAIQKL